MSPQARTRLADGLFAATLPVIAFTTIAFYSWSDSGVLATSILHDARWWIAGVLVFVALVLAAGFLRIGGSTRQAGSPRARGARVETRMRLAWTLLTVAFVAYAFWGAAFSSWSASLPVLISFHFLDFQDWRWWVGALIAFLGLLLAAALVMKGELKTRTLRTTPIDDPTHEFRLDESGNEIAPPPEAVRAATPSAGQALQPAAPAASDVDERVPDLGRTIFRWLRFVLAGLLLLITVHYWFVREIRVDYVLALVLVYTLALLSWWLQRAR